MSHCGTWMEGTRRDATWAPGATRPCHCLPWGRRGRVPAGSHGLTAPRGRRRGVMAASQRRCAGGPEHNQATEVECGKQAEIKAAAAD